MTYLYCYELGLHLRSNKRYLMNDPLIILNELLTHLLGNFYCWSARNGSNIPILVDKVSSFDFETSTFILILLRYHHVKQGNKTNW